MADKIITYETENYIIKINRAQCISCSTCAALAPETFELDNNMIFVVKELPASGFKEVM